MAACDDFGQLGERSHFVAQFAELCASLEDVTPGSVHRQFDRLAERFHNAAQSAATNVLT